MPPTFRVHQRVVRRLLLAPAGPDERDRSPLGSSRSPVARFRGIADANGDVAPILIRRLHCRRRFRVSAISWRAVFLVSVPLAVAAIALTARFVPESRAPRPRRLDPVGQALVIAALGGLTYATVEAGRVGFGAVGIVTAMVLALGWLAALVAYELRRREPLLEMRFFASLPFAGASAIAVMLSGALGGFLFMNTLYLQDVRALSPQQAGLYLLPTAGGDHAGRGRARRRGWSRSAGCHRSRVCPSHPTGLMDRRRSRARGGGARLSDDHGLGPGYRTPHRGAAFSAAHARDEAGVDAEAARAHLASRLHCDVKSEWVRCGRAS
jgi:hypothetical protein